MRPEGIAELAKAGLTPERGYTYLPNWYWPGCKNLRSDQAYRVGLALAGATYGLPKNEADDITWTGFTIEQIMEKTAMNRRQVKRALKTLSELGLLGEDDDQYFLERPHWVGGM